MFIHGLLLSSWVFVRMQRYFTRRGYQCYRFKYSTRRKTIDSSARQLYRWLVANDINHPFMICHSMGGLVCYAYLQHCTNKRFEASKVVCLGSPFNGSMVAKKIADTASGRLLLGVQTRSTLVTGLEKWPFTAPVGIIAGNKNIGAGRLMGINSEKPGDGTVLVDETEIQGARDRIILPVTHSQMTFSARVFRQAEHFYHYNKFEHQNRK